MRIMTLCLSYVFLLTASSTTFPVVCQSHDETLVWSGHGFTNIPRVHESDSSVKTLRLARNSISRFEPQDFGQFPNLTSLDLRINSIRFIHRGSFSSLGGLTELLLGNNRISCLEKQAFTGLTHLLSLDLHGNQIREIQPSAFDGLSKLRLLRLSGNSLTFVPLGIFTGMKSLETLNLENNQIRSLNRHTFRGLQQLLELNLSGNMLSRLPNNVFQPVSPPRALVRSFNVRMQINNAQFKSQVGVKSVSVSNNILSKIDPRTFNHLSNLELLKLNGNHIRRIGRDTFSQCARIREIDLSDNLISTVEESAFADLKHLTVVKLNRNRLSRLDPRAFDSRAGLSSLDLNENPWDCGCGILCLKSWLEGGDDSRSSASVRCSQPELFRGQYLGDISSALIHGTDTMCSHAPPRVICGPTVIADASGLSEPDVVNTEATAMQGEGRRPATDVIIKNARKRDISESSLLRNTSEVRVLPAGGKKAKSIPMQTVTSTKDYSGTETAGNVACVYNHEVIINVSSGSVSSTCAVITWSLTNDDTENIYFRVMYDRFSSRRKFSRFINVRQGTACKLCELLPATPYFVCVESVVQGHACHVASRDLCLGLITAAEPLPGPEPATVTLYLAAVNTLAILGILALVGYTSLVIRRHWSSALSLVFSQNRRVSCAMCAGIPLSDRTAAVHTNSSQTGTYMPNDVDAIDLPPAH